MCLDRHLFSIRRTEQGGSILLVTLTYDLCDDFNIFGDRSRTFLFFPATQRPRKYVFLARPVILIDLVGFHCVRHNEGFWKSPLQLCIKEILFAKDFVRLGGGWIAEWSNRIPRSRCYPEWYPVWPDWVIYCTLGNHSKPLATINLPKFPTFVSNFCKGVKIIHFSSEIILGQLL